MPLVIGFPFRLARPAVIHQRTANVDIWPTVLDLLGLPALRVRRWTLARSRRSSRRPDGGPSAPEDGQALAHLDQTWGQRVQTRAPNVAVSEGAFRYLLFRDAEG